MTLPRRSRFRRSSYGRQHEQDDRIVHKGDLSARFFPSGPRVILQSLLTLLHEYAVRH